MRWRALLSFLALLWLFVLVAVAVGWGPFAGSSLPTSRGVQHAVPVWVERERLPQHAVRGAVLFAGLGCTAWHTYAGYGSQNLGAPDLTAIGARHLGLEFEMAHLNCPSCVKRDSQMPAYSSLGRKPIRDLAIFLEASKRTH